MNTKTNLLGGLTRGVLAAALIACAGVAIGSAMPQPEIAGVNQSDAIKLSRPLGDRGDDEIRNMPVIGGRYS